jgi:transcriptional regulator with XRE-family HTH domain
MSLGQHIRSLREGAGLSRAELARRAGIPASTLRGWEGDRGFPNLPALLRRAAALGVPVERFAEGVEDPAGEEGEPGQRRGTGTGRPAVRGRVASTQATEQQAVPPAGGDAAEMPPAHHKPNEIRGEGRLAAGRPPARRRAERSRRFAPPIRPIAPFSPGR